MRDKYYEERFPRYFVFGTNVDKRSCDVSSSLLDPVATVISDPNVMIEDRGKIVDMLIKLGNKLEELDVQAFREIWYGKE